MEFLRSIKRLFSIYFGKMTIEKRLLFSHVERDWMIMFSIFVIALAFVGIWSTYLFVSISEENLVIERSARAAGVETLNREKLNEVVEFFENREEKFEKLKKQSPEIDNPAE